MKFDIVRAIEKDDETGELVIQIDEETKEYLIKRGMEVLLKEVFASLDIKTDNSSDILNVEVLKPNSKEST